LVSIQSSVSKATNQIVEGLSVGLTIDTSLPILITI